MANLLTMVLETKMNFTKTESLIGLKLQLNKLYKKLVGKFEQIADLESAVQELKDELGSQKLEQLFAKRDQLNFAVFKHEFAITRSCVVDSNIIYEIENEIKAFISENEVK